MRPIGYFIGRPLRRTISLCCLFTLFFTFYSYSTMMTFNDDLDSKASGWPTAHLRARKGFLSVFSGEDLIQIFKYRNSDIKVDRDHLLKIQGITHFDLNDTQEVWPSPEDNDDRILAQLVHVPDAVKEEQKKPFDEQKLKTIILWNHGKVSPGRQRLLDDQCPVTQCYISSAQHHSEKADAVVFNNRIPRGLKKRRDQIWVYYMLESPVNTGRNLGGSKLINWTATYRRDSVIVTPYEKFVPFDPEVLEKPVHKNYAAGKTKMAVVYISNCGARNGRLDLARKLGQYINVDIFGHCGKSMCSKKKKNCFNPLDSDYKFYLSFENSNCRDYITEKLFRNALEHHLVPVVFGAKRSDYERAAPKDSFIYVGDFPSVKDLADYLQLLDNDDDLYNQYFKWRGTGTFINTYFFCRLCAMLWDETKEVWYEDLEAWWQGSGENVCIRRKGYLWNNNRFFLR